jgi:hypothetical protein
MGVIIGMDPHKRSATIEVTGERGSVLAAGRFGTDKAGYAEMLRAGRKFAERIWAIGAATGRAGTSRTGSSPTARPSWTCPRSYQTSSVNPRVVMILSHLDPLAV